MKYWGQIMPKSSLARWKQNNKMQISKTSSKITKTELRLSSDSALIFIFPISWFLFEQLYVNTLLQKLDCWT